MKNLITEEEYKRLLVEQPELAKTYREVKQARPNPKSNGHKIGRNEICPCGQTGKKYKNCCMLKT